MIDYLMLARNKHMSFTRAYVQAHNALVELAKTPNPTNEEFNAFDTLEKQIKLLKNDIAIECVKNEGYTFNEQTQVWEKPHSNN